MRMCGEYSGRVFFCSDADCARFARAGTIGGYLGIPKAYLKRSDQAKFELTRSSSDAQTTFEVEVAPDSSYLRLIVGRDQVRAVSNVTDGSTWFALDAIVPSANTFNLLRDSARRCSCRTFARSRRSATASGNSL